MTANEFVMWLAGMLDTKAYMTHSPVQLAEFITDIHRILATVALTSDEEFRKEVIRKLDALKDFHILSRKLKLPGLGQPDKYNVSPPIITWSTTTSTGDNSFVYNYNSDVYKIES